MLKTVPKLNLTIPDHTILDKIGEGGMSAVYLGRQISLQRKVAIKVLKKLVMDDKTLAERFVNEAKTVASLDHPHIISIYEAKKLPSGLAYFTMPYLTHGDFGEIICTNSDHLIDLLCQICEGLAHAHNHGVIHRDLKPENILFDQFGRIKIADFGIAITKDTVRKTKETQLLGSAHYMSPEHIQSKSIDHRSDIYSLGCIICEKITGDHVFNEKNDFQILMAHVNKPVPRLPAALSEWQPVIDKCMAKDPNDRYQSVEQVKEALLAIKHHKETTPESIITPELKAKFSKPHYVGIAASLLTATVMILLWALTKGPEPTANTTTLPVDTKTVTEPVVELPKSEPSEPLKITVGVIEKPAENETNEEELVDLTGNLDNEQINEMSIEVTLNEAQQLLESYRLTKPKGDNAADKFQQILLEYPDNVEAQTGLQQVGVYYFSLINSKLKENQTSDARKHVDSVASYFSEYGIDKSSFENSIKPIIEQTQMRVNQAIEKRRPNLMTDDYLAMTALLTEHDSAYRELKKQYDQIPQKGDLKKDQNGHSFVFFPAINQGKLKDIWISQTEVTVAQFQAFAGDGFTDEKCHHFGKKLFFKKTWEKPPFDQTSSHPVVCISFENAQAYAQWLSKQTGNTYRLPTSQEWQFLNQQAATSNSCKAGNLAGTEVQSESKATDKTLNCDDGFVFTAPVQSFPANNNLNDLNGNTAEWVSDCNGNTSCAAGNSWLSGQGSDNNSFETLPPNETHSHVGFRLVKEI